LQQKDMMSGAGSKDKRMARPVGVTIIAISCFLVALYDVLSGIRLIARGVFTPTLADGTTNSLAQLGAAIILIMIIFTVLYALAGWGLWKLRSWARWLAIFLAAVGIAFRSLLWFLTSHHPISQFFVIAITFAIYGVIVGYLLKENVKAAFLASET
jgi:hypothetical protein